MSIEEIKSRLLLKDVLHYYGLQPDKYHRLHCPFHNDKTPSLQLYYKTQTAYCFSTNCKTHGKSLDVIDFVMHMENSTKHEAIEKCKSLIGGTGRLRPAKPIKTEAKQAITNTVSDEERHAILTRMFTYFKNAVHNSPPGRDYIESRSLDYTRLEIGYNTGQFHHGERKDEALIKSCEKVGLLSPFGTNNRTGGQAYKPFAKGCICFALKDQSGRISGLYFRSMINNKKQRHFYLKGRQGLYPKYPHPDTTKLIITESIIDAASLLQHEGITKQHEILALYGTNGFSREHTEAIKTLNNLEEVIFFLNGDEAGRKAVQKYAEALQYLKPELTVSNVNIPAGEDVNSLLQSHVNESGQGQPEIFTHLLQERTFLSQPLDRKEPFEVETTIKPQEETPENHHPALQTHGTGEKITWESEELKITIWGGIEYGNLHRLKLSLHLKYKHQTFRDEVNLYSNRSRKAFLQDASEELEIQQSTLKARIDAFTAAVEEYRYKRRKTRPNTTPPPVLTTKEQATALDTLKSPQLTAHLKTTMQQAGLIGETDNGLLLFLIFLTRFFEHPLHALVHGSSGSGKTNLLKTILKLVPGESKYETTALSENVLFRPPHKEFWKNKILLLEDLDGSYKALYPLREFMSNQHIHKFVSEPDPKTGQFKQVLLEAHGPIVIAGATTRDKVYEDNSNRSFLLHVDESKAHQQAILDYQNRQAAGLIEEHNTTAAITRSHHLQRMLKTNIKIINPFQPQLKLPEYVFKKLRTNTHYITLIKAITFLHQYQREQKQSAQGTYIETTLEDVALANRLSKHSLLRKSDELSGQVRDFFESLKNLLSKTNTTTFLSGNIRNQLRMHPMKFNRRITELRQRGYLKQVGGNRKTGYEYQITLWDDYRILQKGLNVMDETLEKLYKQYPDGKYRPAKPPEREV